MSTTTLSALLLVLLGTVLGTVLARHLPLWLARRTGRSAGLVHVGPGALDAVQRLERLVIDTDRTITTGHLVVTEVQALDPTDDRTLRWFAGALAHRGDDPVNRAIAKLAGNGRITGVRVDPDLGLRGSVDRHPVRIGRADWLDPTTVSPQGTTVGVEIDHRPLGRISVADEVRSDAGQHLAQLRHHGVHPLLVSLSPEPDVARLAELAGVDEWYAGTDPLSVAQKLGGAESRVGWAAARAASNGSAHGGAHGGEGAEPTPCEVELVLPGQQDKDNTVRARDSSVASIVASLRLLRRTHAARRAAQRVAWASLVLLPVAAAGLLSPVAAAGAALGVLALVAATAVVVVTGGGGDSSA